MSKGDIISKDKLLSKIEKKTKGLLSKDEIDVIIGKVSDDNYTVTFLRDLEKFKEKMVLQKDKNNNFGLNRIVQEGQEILPGIGKKLKFGRKKPFKEPQINPEDLMVISIISYIFKYIEIFYNRIRLHSTLNYKSPEDYENERKMSKLCV